MGGCVSAVREKKQSVIIHTTNETKKPDVWQAYVEYEDELETETELTQRSWHSQNLYAHSTSNFSVDRTHLTGEVEQEDHPLTPLDFVNSHGTVQHPLTPLDSVNSHGTVQMDTLPTPQNIPTPQNVTSGSEDKGIQSRFSSVDEFDEHKVKPLPRMAREESSFLEFSEPIPVKTRSGRWGLLVVDHVGTDGTNRKAMVKAGDEKPEMRKFSSFEMRSFHSFERRVAYV